jgi:hypothetical protein
VGKIQETGDFSFVHYTTQSRKNAKTGRGRSAEMFSKCV